MAETLENVCKKNHQKKTLSNILLNSLNKLLYNFVF